MPADQDEVPTGTGPTAPTSTYRLQIHRQFDLTAAAEVTGYLADLGAGAVYLSPILQATTGSDHGYDVTRHDRVDSDRGGEAGRNAVTAAADSKGLPIVLDIVPNHMGVADAAQNPVWWDLLRLGPDSDYASWFDIDWAAGGGRLNLPVLGDDAGEDDLEIVDGELRYYEHRFPIAPGTAAPGESAAAVHARQHYRLLSYRLADTEQNYRRFFAITDLAGLRVEDPAVFQATHAEILTWVSAGDIEGIRIDHPDGLADPGQYLRRLRAAAPQAWITVEKITEPGEELPADWPVAGTTGYDALTEVHELLYDPAAGQPLTELYQRLTGDHRSFADHVAAGKRQVADTILQAELRRLSRLVPEVPDAVDGLAELAAAFAVYRSYLPQNREQLTAAAELAGRRRPDLVGVIGTLTPLLAAAGTELSIRFEQATGAIMAKGVEDTAYYRYTRALGLNEVGGDPATVGCTVQEFHRRQQHRQQRYPQAMTTLSTHDTKRSEDVRARLAVLGELGAAWADPAAELMRLAPVPNAAFGYLIWQSFVGAGWIDRERMQAYLEKAAREANDGTGWRDPDAAFEAAVRDVVDRAYDDPQLHSLLDGLITLVDRPGWSNSLAQKLVQLTMPGIPDVYQGTEVWDYSLVDPDNRRPVDFDRLRTQLASLDDAAGHTGWTPPALDGSGAAKLWLTAQVLRQRRRHPELFTGYQPLTVAGPAAEHAVAFDRGGAVTVATRLPVGLAARGGWGATTLALPAGRWRDRLTGSVAQGEVALGELLAGLPVAFLTRD